MYTVTLTLNDVDEYLGLSTFLKELEAYRSGNSVPQSQPQPAPESPMQEIERAIKTAQPVVASISADGAVKAPAQAELYDAAQAYMNKHGLDKALALVRTFGAAKMTEITDPAKLVELLKQLKAGVE